MACTCCPGRSAIVHTRRLNAAALHPGGSPRQAVQGHCDHRPRIVRVGPELRTEFLDLERALEETIPDCGSHREKEFDKRNRWVLSCLRCREEWRGSGIRGSGTRQLLRRRLRRNVSGTPANGFVIPLHAAARVAGRPAGLILEQANGANAAVSAEIEPVQRAARNANQVAGFHFYRHNRALLRVDMEQSAPGDDVADLVRIVAMLDVERCEHRIQPGSVRSDVDHIRGDVATLALELLDLLAAGAQYLIRGSIRRQVARRLPMFVVNANSGEIVAHLVVFAERTVFIGDSKDRHGNLSPGSGTAGITHSVQRRNEPTLPSGTPESQRGAWLPASPHPKYKAHAPSEENRGCPGFPAGLSKCVLSVQPCPANSPESAATRGAYAFERLPGL